MQATTDLGCLDECKDTESIATGRFKQDLRLSRSKEPTKQLNTRFQLIGIDLMDALNGHKTPMEDVLLWLTDDIRMLTVLTDLCGESMRFISVAGLHEHDLLFPERVGHGLEGVNSFEKETC